MDSWPLGSCRLDYLSRNSCSHLCRSVGTYIRCYSCDHLLHEGFATLLSQPDFIAPKNCVTPTKVQSAAISVVATAAKFWNKTLSWGLGGSGGGGFGKGFGFYGSGSARIAVSPNGNAAYVLSFSAPAALTGTGTLLRYLCRRSGRTPRAKVAAPKPRSL